jgi:hypothetical protein
MIVAVSTSARRYRDPVPAERSVAAIPTFECGREQGLLKDHPQRFDVAEVDLEDFLLSGAVPEPEYYVFAIVIDVHGIAVIAITSSNKAIKDRGIWTLGLASAIAETT